MENRLFKDISNAYVTFNSSVYNPTYAGIYTVVVTYKWGGLGSDISTTRKFTYTLNDPCIPFVQIPTFSDLSGNLHDTNTIQNVQPTISFSQYDFCAVSVSMAVTRGGTADTSGLVQFTDVPTTSIHDYGTRTI